MVLIPMLEPIPMLVPAPLWSRLRFWLFRSESRLIPIKKKTTGITAPLNWTVVTVSHNQLIGIQTELHFKISRH